MGSVKTAVFPVAGFGTRFLPATKAMPKALLPIIDRPLIQFAVDEALSAGIESLVFITGRGHGAIEDYFDMSYELEHELAERGKEQAIDELTELRPDAGQIVFVRQVEPLGLGHAVWCARNLIGNGPFAVLLADELIRDEPGALKRMIDLHDAHGGNVVLVDEVEPANVGSYGIVTPLEDHGDHVTVSSVVEKPAPNDAPSNLAVIGRYVLQPEVMEHLSSTEPGTGGEIQLTDAILTSLESTELRALKNTGTRFDCGSPEGFLEATIEMAGQRPDLAGTLERMTNDSSSQN